jgi:2-dehydro-3-deoxyphosphogluconate aldolase/(4S)-4-hydroxy-2-oxoglutarate aldolase
VGRDFSWQQFEALPIVGILRGFEVPVVRGLVEAAARGGLRCVEVTMNSPAAGEAIAAAIEVGGDEVQVGAGTVCTLEDLERALGAGASFIVTPIVSPEVISACRERDIPVMAGALTPTEICAAWSQGADMVKVFPANQFGPGYLKDLRGPLSEVRLMPTGGVDASTLGDFHSAGASAFGVGGALFGSTTIDTGSWGQAEEGARSLVEAYESVSGGD